MIDMATGAKIADLEQFTVFRGSKQVTAVDVNFWGVTFARDSDRFYATLATGGKTYLIEGSVSERRAHVIHENVECPSLSPDGTRIAYKKRTGSASAPWRLTVLDLATMRETPIADDALGRRPGRVARRRPRALRRRRRGVEGQRRRHRRAAALPRAGGLARGGALERSAAGSDLVLH